MRRVEYPIVNPTTYLSLTDSVRFASDPSVGRTRGALAAPPRRPTPPQRVPGLQRPCGGWPYSRPALNFPRVLRQHAATRAALCRRRPHTSYGKPMPPDGPTLGSVSCECVDCTVRTADRIDEALSVILSQTCRTFNDTFPDRGQTTTPLTVSGPTVVRKGLLEQLIRTRSNGKV